MAIKPRRELPRPSTTMRTNIEESMPEHALLGSPEKARFPPGGLAADGGDRDVAHCRIGLGAVPMAFAGLDVHDVVTVTVYKTCRLP